MKELWNSLHWTVKNLVVGVSVVGTTMTLIALGLFLQVFLFILATAAVFGLGAGVRLLYDSTITAYRDSKERKERARKRGW